MPFLIFTLFLIQKEKATLVRFGTNMSSLFFVWEQYPHFSQKDRKKQISIEKLWFIKCLFLVEHAGAQVP